MIQNFRAADKTPSSQISTLPEAKAQAILRFPPLNLECSACLYPFGAWQAQAPM
jgi:hypothetical protein